MEQRTSSTRRPQLDHLYLRYPGFAQQGPRETRTKAAEDASNLNHQWLISSLIYLQNKVA